MHVAKLARRPLLRPIAGFVLFVLAIGSAAASQDQANEHVLSLWAQTSQDGTATLVRQADGSTRLEWRLNLSQDVYRNVITAPQDSGQTITPFGTGDFNKTQFSTEVRLVSTGGDQAYLQWAGAASNDRAVLSRYREQLSNLQMGAVGPRYAVNAGDVAANFSQLGSTLGLRGLHVSRQFDGWALASHVGVIGESWEALANRAALDGRPARSRFLRDVYGAKLDRAWSGSLKTFLSFQGYEDRESSLPQAPFAPSTTRAGTMGFNYQQGQFLLTGEAARSRFQEKNLSERVDRAFVLDGTWRSGAWAFRGGWHDVGPLFVSLAQAVPPGVREHYLGADWTAAPWLMLGMDARDAVARTAALEFPSLDPELPPPPPLPATRNRARTLNSRANLNLGMASPSWMGWNMGVNAAQTRSEDASNQESSNDNFNAMLSYASAKWQFSSNMGIGKLSSAAAPTADSRSRNEQINLGRTWSETTATGLPVWSLGLQLNLGRNNQRLLSQGTSTTTSTLGVTMSGQRTGWGQASLALSESITTQPNGGADLKSRMAQLEMTRPLGTMNTLRAYYRYMQRNSGTATLETTERVGGIQINLIW